MRIKKFITYSLLVCFFLGLCGALIMIINKSGNEQSEQSGKYQVIPPVVRDTLASGPKVDTTIKEVNEEYKWQTVLPNGTTFAFGKKDPTAVSGQGGVLPIVRITNKDGYFVKYSYKNNFVSPKVHGNVIEWELEKGVIARYTMEFDRVKADYIVSDKEKIASNTINFLVESNLEGELYPQNEIVWLNKETAEIFSIPAPVIIDSDNNRFDGSYSLKKGSENHYQLAINFPKDKLATAKFPITIDPVTIDSAATAVGTAYGNGRKILRDSFGNLIALVDGGTGDDNVFYKNSGAVAWTKPDPGIDLDGAGGSSLEISADLNSSNNVELAFRDTTDSAIAYVRLTVTRDGSNNITSIAVGTPFNLDTAPSAKSVRPSLIVANKGEGSGKEKIALAYATNSVNADGFNRGEVRFMQCDVADGCDAASEWKNASEELNGNGTCSDSATSGDAGLPTDVDCQGTTDQILPDLTDDSKHHVVLVQVPGSPRRSPGSVKLDNNGTFSTLSNANDNNTATTSDISTAGDQFGTNDYLYVGDNVQFSKVAVDVGDTAGDANANASTFAATTVEYCSANSDTNTTCDSWSDLSSFFDNTATSTVAFSEDGSILFAEPTTWVQSTEDSVGKYWVRFRPSADFDTVVKVRELYITDRNAKALLAMVGHDRLDDLGSAYVIWDEIGQAGWENMPTVAGDGWQELTTSIHTLGANWTTFTNFPLAATVDYVNNAVYVSYIVSGINILSDSYITNTVDLAAAASWTSIVFPAVTETATTVLSLTADGGDIYLFYVLAPDSGSATGNLVFRKCSNLCDAAADWGSERSLVNYATTIDEPTHPQAIVSKTLGDTIAIDLLYTSLVVANTVDYERHYVDMADETAPVSASGDDAYHRDCDTGTDDQDITATTVKLGREDTDGSCDSSVDSENHVGLRFPSIAVAQGAAISSAYIDVRVAVRTGSTVVDFTVYGEDADNASEFSALTNCTDPCSGSNGAVEVRTRTTSSSALSINFETNTYRIDVTNMVQEIVCRGAADSQPCIGNFNGAGAWASGNAISLLLISAETGDTDNSATFVSQNDTTTIMIDPTLQINCVTSCGSENPRKNYSAGEVRALPSGSGSYTDFDHPLSASEYTSVDTDDSSYYTIPATSNHISTGAYPVIQFKAANPSNNNTRPVDAKVVVKSSVPTTSKTIYLQIYRGGSTNDWVTQASSTTSPADTDITLSATVTANVSEYYFAESGQSVACDATSANCWSYWRIYQDAPVGTSALLSVDYITAYNIAQVQIRGGATIRGGTKLGNE